MDAPSHRHSNGAVAGHSTAEIPPESSISVKTDGPKYTSNIAPKRNKKKKKAPISDTGSSVSSASSNNCCSAASSGFKISRNPKRIRVGSIATTRRSLSPRDVEALGLPLGMSIAAVVAQVLERSKDARGKVSVDYLSKICVLAVRESLVNVYGDKFDSFVANFENSFRSTLMTLKLINESSQEIGVDNQRVEFRDSTVETSNSQEPVEENINTNLMQRQLVLHREEIASENTSLSNSVIVSNMEKSVMEQTRSNDLKAVEIGLIMKKLQLKEKQLSLHSDLNLLERWKLSMGFSKASFKAEKFKTQFQDTKQVELIKICLDLLVAGLIIMLVSLGYGTYVYSHRRITEATEACSPPMESKSWWMPKSMSTFNTGLHLLKCQIQVLSRMLFGLLLIGLITVLLFQRSSTSNHTMPVTFIVLLLGIGCGYAGRFCIDTLGGSGNHWLIYWEILCSLHFFSYIFQSRLLFILNGPINIAERAENHTVFPYWIRRLLFYAILLILPLLCGLMPFASLGEWINHFSSQAMDYMTVIDD